ncbi:hypothetical protein J6590_012411 [Homalodisca vitripennis]|nr:hypothetical protein J6590_012411 [Homalodisca vitripennis]
MCGVHNRCTAERDILSLLSVRYPVPLCVVSTIVVLQNEIYMYPMLDVTPLGEVRVLANAIFRLYLVDDAKIEEELTCDASLIER